MSPAEATSERAGSSPATDRPLVSVVMPAHETPERLLSEAIDSVRRQTYRNWELRIVDDGSVDPGVARAIGRAVAADQRIKPMRLERGEGISAATNRGLDACEGLLVAFLDHDDLLAPVALERVTEQFTRHPETDVLYSDEDKLTAEGNRVDPFRKPDFSPVYALGAMYVGHLLTVRRSLLTEVGGLDPAFDTVQDFDLLLRLSERTDRIVHLPEVLYHWRAVPGSIAAGAEHKPSAAELQAAAVNAHLARRRVPARATPHPAIPHRCRLAPAPGFDRPPVSVIVTATGGEERLGRCLRFLPGRGEDGVEVIAVVPAGHPRLPAGVRRSERAGGGPRRARSLNEAAGRAQGALLLFLDDDVEVAEPGWLDQLALLAAMPSAGPVGPMLASPDGRVASAGWVLGLDQPAVPAMAGIGADGDGHYGALACAREVSALTGACLMIGREQFADLGGFREDYHCGFEDFDLCLRSLARGRSPIYAPTPTLIWRRGPAEGRRWTDLLDRGLFVDLNYDELAAGDRYYSPGLGRERAAFEPVETAS